MGIVRFLLFRAVKQSDIGKTIGGALQQSAENALRSAPLIPLPTG
jgi:hypothetical protein